MSIDAISEGCEGYPISSPVEEIRQMKLKATLGFVKISDWRLIKQAIQNAPPNSCVVFDVDEVLVDSNRLIRTGDYAILDSKVLEVIDLIKERNIKAYALTHGGWGTYGDACFEDMRIEGLRKIGIDFTSLSQYSGRFEMPQGSKWPLTRVPSALMKNGVIFARDHCHLFCKGEILFQTLKQLEEAPAHIIFIDDCKYNLEAMQEKCIANGVSFQGFEYQAPSHLLEASAAK